MPEVTATKPRNRIQRLYVDDSVSESELKEFETGGYNRLTGKYRIVLNCRAESDDSRLKRKIEIGRI